MSNLLNPILKMNSNFNDENKEVFDIRYKSPLFMPEKFSRIKLKITGVRVERIQDISEEDSIKEGVKRFDNGTYKNYSKESLHNFTLPRNSYHSLINSIHKKNIWKENPFVFVYDFEVLTNG